jgi:uncharacterized protein
MPEHYPPTILTVTERTQLRRGRTRGSMLRSDLEAVLQAGFVCHLGVLIDGAPVVIPTLYGFRGDTLYLHGSVASRSLTEGPLGTVCVTVTHVDGLVLARSVFEHSINYRSAMVFGTPRRVTDPDELLLGLRCLTEQAAPGQWDYARRPSRKELAATTLLALRLEEASVKIRRGPPDDGDSEDAALGLWAGVLPLMSTWGPPQTDPALLPDLVAPEHVAARAHSVQGSDCATSREFR